MAKNEKIKVTFRDIYDAENKGIDLKQVFLDKGYSEAEAKREVAKANELRKITGRLFARFASQMQRNNEVSASLITAVQQYLATQLKIMEQKARPAVTKVEGMVYKKIGLRLNDGDSIREFVGYLIDEYASMERDDFLKIEGEQVVSDFLSYAKLKETEYESKLKEGHPKKALGDNIYDSSVVQFFIDTNEFYVIRDLLHEKKYIDKESMNWIDKRPGVNQRIISLIDTLAEKGYLHEGRYFKADKIKFAKCLGVTIGSSLASRTPKNEFKREIALVIPTRAKKK